MTGEHFQQLLIGRHYHYILFQYGVLVMDTILVLGAIFLVAKFVFSTITAPSRSAASLKRIEEELRSRR